MTYAFLSTMKLHCFNLGLLPCRYDLIIFNTGKHKTNYSEKFYIFYCNGTNKFEYHYVYFDLHEAGACGNKFIENILL